MHDAIKIVRITRNDWERVQQHAVAFEPFHQALTRALDKLGEYECEYEEVDKMWNSNEMVRIREGEKDPSEGWDDDERLRPEPPEPERWDVEDMLRQDEEERRQNP